MKLFDYPLVRTHAPQLFKFAMAGGMGSVLDLGTLTLLTRVFLVPAEVSFLISAFVGATFVFFVNKVFTFKNHDARIGPQLLKHYTVYGPAIIANGFLSSFIYWFGVPDLLAKFIAIGIIAMWNYTMSHNYVFKR